MNVMCKGNILDVKMDMNYLIHVEDSLYYINKCLSLEQALGAAVMSLLGTHTSQSF